MSNKFCPNLNLPESKALIEKVGLSNFYTEYIKNGYNVPSMEYIDSIPENKTINFSFNSIELLNSDRGRQIFNKGKKNNWTLNKVLDEIGGFGNKTGYKALFGDINRSVKDLSIEELSMDIASNYSYTVEINTATRSEADEIANMGISETGSRPFQPQQIPTQHYSNLTVPGGTNYTENEIATPLITPSIKGHAQFATDNGIGWFRSDDKSIGGELYQEQQQAGIEEMDFDEDGRPIPTYASRTVDRTKGGISTKTRRILEVQSDLFQKGRDKQDLISKEESGDGYERGFTRGNKEYNFDTYTNEYWYVENNKSTFISKEEYEKAKSIRIDSKENQFLQLLNKDNNWVTFFIKSIIQDSAKKGYEKVLFPLGDTASKIEGHATLEEFKKEKEDRIAQLQMALETDLAEPQDAYKSNEQLQNEINQLKQELERVETEGFAALRPIYNFYENTVTNILKKQGYSPKEITDEYGNKWNQIDIKTIQDIRVYLDISEIPETRSVEDIVFVNKELFDAYQQDTIIDSFVYQIYTKNQEGETGIKNSIREDFVLTEEFFRYDPTNQNIIAADNYKNILDNFDEFYTRAEQRLLSKGVKKVPNLDSENEDSYGLEDTKYDYEGATYQKLNYSDEATFVQSSKDTASSHIKNALSFVPKYEIENGRIAKEIIDGKEVYMESLNFIGLPQYEDMDAIWNDLLYTLIDIPIGKKLDYLKNSGNPKHQAIYKIIVNNPNTQIQNEFETTFSKQQAKFVTVVVGRPDGNGYKTISVLDTNRYNVDNLIIDDWYNNMLESPLVKINKEGERYIDTERGKLLKNEYQEAVGLLRSNPKTALSNIKKVLSKAGINMSDVALASEGLKIGNKTISVDDILRNQVRYIFNRLAGEVGGESINTEDLLENNNPYINENRPLELLAKLENQTNPSVFEGSFISGDGKAKYSFVNNSFLSHRFRELTSNLEFAKQLKGTSYASGSYYLEQLTGPNRENFLHNFSLHYVDSIGNDSSNQTNKPFRRMNTKEKEFFRVSLFQNGNKDSAYFIGLTPSDKTTLPLFKVPKINIGNFSKSATVNSETKRILLNQFTSEYNRVKETIKQNDNPDIIKIDQYHGKTGMGSKFIIFPWANDLLFKDGNLLELGTTEMAQVWSEMEKFLVDLVNDQRDYWSQLGIYNDSLFDKSYRSKKGGNITDLAAQYAINNFIFLHNQTQLISGDPALHGKSVLQDKEKGIIESEKSIDKTWNNYYKRLAKDIAPGLDGNFENSSYRVVFLKDLEYVSDHLNEYLEKVGGHLSDAYGGINPADAQEYTTLDEHLKVLEAYGRVDQDTRDAVEKLKNNDNLSEKELNELLPKVLQPTKPVYVGTKIENNIEKFYYIKTSSFPLIPALTRGLEIDKLRKAMEDPVTGADRAVYESGVKLGLQGEITNISNDGGTSFNNISFNEKQVINLNRSGFRIQQELPYHGLYDSINEGSQGRKLVLSNIIDTDVYTFNNKEYTGSELKNIYEQLHIEKMDRAWDSLLKDISYNPETRRIENLSRLADILKEEATSRDYPVNDIYSIQLVEENGKYKFKVPLGFTNNSSRFESILNSLVTNRVIKSELPGFTLVQAAGSGFTKQPQFTSDERIQDYSGSITWVDPKDTKLNYIREENGRLVSADILVPNYFKDINLKDYIVGGYLDLNRIPEELLTIIGLRIPTQGKNSMMKFRVKGFLPNYMGELTVVPAEITAQMGSDFDVDKLFLYRYHYKKNKNGDLKKVQKDLSDTAVDIDYSKLTGEQIDNLIIQMFEDILSDTRFYDEIVEPNGFGKLPKAAELVSSLDKTTKQKHDFSSRAQNTMYEVNADGKLGTGIFSLFSTFYRIAQDVNLGITVPLKFKNNNGQIVEVTSLGSQNTIEGGKKSNTIMYLQSAAVDNSKEQVLGKLNINEYTMNEAGVMAMLGLPEDFIGYFMSQPAIKQFVRRVSQNGDILDGEFDSNIISRTIEDIQLQYTNGKKIPGINSLLDIITYNTNDLITSLQQNTTSTLPSELDAEQQKLLSSVNDLFQLKIITDFKKFVEIAGAVRVLQSATNIDTKGVGSNLIAVESKYNQFVQLDKAFNSKEYPLVNSQKIFENTSVGRAKAILEDTRNIFSQILPYGSPVYTNTINSVLELGDLISNEVNLKLITNDLKSYILSSKEFVGSDIVYTRDSLLYGENNVAKRWGEYSKTDAGKNNPLTKRIKPRYATKTGELNSLRALNTPASNNKVDIDNSITYFYNMLNSSNADERQLAEDLVKYHLLTGAQYGPNSIGKYITYDALERYNFSKKLRDIDNALYTSDVDFTGFFDQFFSNNPFKAKSVNFDLVGDKIEIKRLGTGILTNQGTAAGYIVKYDSKKREPLLYKLIGVGAGDSFVYGKLLVNNQHKTIKNYNFEQGPLLNSSVVKPKEDNPVLSENYPLATEQIVDKPQVLIDNYNIENSSGIDEVLNRILERTNQDYKKNIAYDLLDNIDLLSSVDINISSERPEANGWYDSSNNTIYINATKISQFANMNGKFEEVFLHELLHAATVNLLSAEDSLLSAKQKTARNKIKRLFEEYSKNVDQEVLTKYRELYNKTNRTSEDIEFLQNNKSVYYPLLNIEEFIAAGLTSEDFRNTLKSNNLWTRFLDLIANLLGINTNDLDILYSSTIELISDNTQDIIKRDTSFEDFSELNSKELAIRQFIEQRDKFFVNWKVKDYWSNLGKKYSADTQRKMLEANSNPNYDRLKIWFWNNELRISHVDPRTKLQGTHFDISDLPESQEDSLINKMIKTYQGRLDVLERRRRGLGDTIDVRLDRDIERTRDKINKLKGERSIINIYETSTVKMNEIEEGLNSENINAQDLADYNAYLTEFLVINQQVDFDTTDEEGIGLNYTNKFNTLAGRASALKRLYNKKATELLEKAGYYYLGMNPEQLGVDNLTTLGAKDVGTLESGYLDFSQSTSKHIQNIGYLIERGQFNANERYIDQINELNTILTEYVKKYGNNFNQLLQVDSNGKRTGYLINKYKDDFYKKSKGNKKFWRENSQAILTEENKKAFESARKDAADLYKNEIGNYNNWLANNDPNIWIDNYNTGKKIDWDGPARRYIRLVPHDKWIDDKYTQLKNKGETDPAVRLYNFIEPIYRKANKKYGQQVNYIPEVQLSAKDLVIKGKYKGAAKAIWTDWSRTPTEVADIREEDDKIRELDIDTLTNEPRQYVFHKMFGNKLETDYKSFDLGEITAAVIHQEETIKSKLELEPLLNIYYALLKDSKSIVTYNGIETSIDAEPRKLTEQAKYLINGWLYGQIRAQGKTEETFGKYTDQLISYIRVSGMGWNPFSAIGNITQSLTSNMIFATGNRQYFTESNYFRSLGENLHQIAGNSSRAKKIRNAFRFTDALVLTNELNFGKDRNLSNVDRFKDTSFLDPFYMTERAEYFNQGQTMVAMLMQEKIQNLKGETKSIWDAFDNDFNWKTEEFGPDIFKEDPTKKFKLQSKIRKAIIDVHGNYARPIQAKKHFYNRALLVFRTWLPQAIHNRAGGYRKDEFLGTEMKGRYLSYGAFVKNKDNKFDFAALRANLLWLLKLSNNTELSDVDKINMRKNLGELLLLVALASAIMIMKAYLDDDDENELTTYVLNSMLRAQSDITMFMSPTAWDTVIKDPIPVMSPIRSLIDWGEAGVNTIMGDGTYKSGFRKGQSKLFKETVDLIPGIRQPFKQWSYMQQLFGER